MGASKKVLGTKLIKKLWIAFILIILLMGACYILITGYFANKYNEATIQKVNAKVANHLIEEKVPKCITIS